MRHRGSLRCLAACCVLLAAEARAGEPAEPVDFWSLGYFAGGTLSGSSGAYGGALATGLRLGIGRYFAGSFDVGYGLLGASAGMQDRWWAIPSVAAVLQTGPLRFDLGVGLGVGTSSGYGSWSEYFAAPFAPGWHDTAAAIRGQIVEAYAIAPRLDLFLRAEIVSLLGAGSAAMADTLWFAVLIGIQYRIL